MRQIVLYFFLLSGITAHAQFIKRPLLGVHLVAYDFRVADSLSLFGKHLKAGLALSLQNNWAKHWGYCASLEGAFIDFTNRDRQHLDDGKKQLLLQADGAIRYHFTGEMIQPYVQAGGGLSKFSNYYGAFASGGAGLQISFTDKLFMFVNAG